MDMIKLEDISIIIPHLGETKEQVFSLEHCVESLIETFISRDEFFDPDIIIAINGNTQGTKTTNDVPENCLKFKRIVLTEQGQCHSTNAAVAMSNKPWLLITNDDMIYPDGWFKNLTRPLEEHPEILCMSPKLVEPRSGAPTFEVYFCGGAGGDFDKQKFIDFARAYRGQGLRTGFNLPFLIRRDVWDTVGGYDVKYDPWGSNSDSDLEYKIRLAGIQPIQNTDSVVYHFGQTSGTFEPRNQGYWNKNWEYFIEKWGFPRTDDGIWEANFYLPDPPIRKYRPSWEGKYAIYAQSIQE